MMTLIQKLIHDAAVEKLRKRKTVSPHEAPEMSMEELDRVLFDGNMERGEARPFGIRESFDQVAKINTSDITEFERQMNEIVANSPNAILSFAQQKNGYPIMLKNEGAVSVVANGKIVFGNQGEMTWMFSIPNGFRIQTDDLQVDQSNKDIITNLANYYDTWQKDWRQKLLSPDGGQDSDEEQVGNDFRSTPGAPTMGTEPPAPQGGEGGPTPAVPPNPGA